MTSGRSVNQGASIEPIRTSPSGCIGREFDVPDALLQLIEDRNAGPDERVAVDRRLDALGNSIHKSRAERVLFLSSRFSDEEGNPQPSSFFLEDVKDLFTEIEPRRRSLSDVVWPLADAPTEDDRFYAPLSETVGTRPLWISVSQNRWCDVLMCRGAGLVNRHYHPQQVFAYTISGKWGYLEHDWVATAGDWVYEAPGESHTLIAYECDEPMRVTFNVTGPLIWLDENGEPNGTFDVFDYIALVRDHYEKNGIGADYIDQLMR